MKIIFLDIDGPLIPHRMYYMGDRPYNPNAGSFIWDPVAVQMINLLCSECQAQVVFNTAHNENPAEVMLRQANHNGLNHTHADIKTSYPFTDNRYQAITEWLDNHNTISDWIVIDDVQVCLTRQIKVDWEVGITLENYKKAHKMLDGPPKLFRDFVGRMHTTENIASGK